MKSLSIALPVLLLGACSLINSFEDVKAEAVDGAGGETGEGGAGGNADAGGSGSGGGGGRANSGGTAGADASVGGTAQGGATGGGGGGVPSTGGGPNDSGADVFQPAQPLGVLVAYSRNNLVVVDPAAGRELSSEPIGAVKGIINERGTNYWYIFVEAATPADGSTLHVRLLDPKTGAWRELGTALNLPTPAGRLGVLNERLVYLSRLGANDTFTLLNTRDPIDVRVVGNPNRPTPPGLKQGLLATSSSATAVGGVVNLVVASNNCPLGVSGLPECDVNVFHYIVNATDIVPGVSAKVGVVSDTGSVAAVLDQGTPLSDVIAFPTPADTAPDGGFLDGPRCANPPTTTGSVRKFSPVDLSPRGQALSFSLESDALRYAAFDSCNNILFAATTTKDSGIFAVPLTTGGIPQRVCTDAGGGLSFEPYTRTLYRIRQSGAPEAYRVTGTNITPVLTGTTTAVPPNFTPTQLAVRATPACN